LFEALFHAGRGPEAIGAYAELVAKQPTFTLGAHHVLTYALLHDEDATFDSTLERLGPERKREQEIWRARRAMAEAHYREAIAQLQRLPGSAEDDSGALAALLAAYLLAGDVDAAERALPAQRGTMERMAAYAIARSRGGEASEERSTLIDKLIHVDEGGDQIEPLVRLLLMELPTASAPELAPHFERLPKDPDPRLAMLAIVHAAFDPSASIASDDRTPELAAASEALVHHRAGRAEEAKRAWALAAERSVDGRFVLVERFLAGQCDAVRRPRIFGWEWVVLAPRCR
jgi:hypothetical protein